MAYAMMFPEVRAGRKKKEISQNCEILSATEANNISRARFILKHAPETAKLVRDGHPNCGGWRTPRDYFPVVALTLQLESTQSGGWRTPRDYFFVAFLNPPERRCLPRFRTAKFKIILIIMNQ